MGGRKGFFSCGAALGTFGRMFSSLDLITVLVEALLVMRLPHFFRRQGKQDPVIVIGMLEVIFRQHAIAG